MQGIRPSLPERPKGNPEKGSVVRLLLYILYTTLIITLLVRYAPSQISPGPLSRAHRDLNGPASCTQCHAVSLGSPSFRCQDCHREIALRLQQHRGLHAQYVPAGSTDKACVRCHSEHNGADFQLIRWVPSLNSFDHSKTGFTLDGKHVGLECKRCHNREKISLAERATMGKGDLNHSYLGLSRGCTSCHQDTHRGQLGNKCLQCHNTIDWKGAKSFDHSKTRFALSGAHRQLTCQKCHTAGANGALKYAGMKFDRCSSCHDDIHRGAFKQGCDSCHNTITWKKTPFVTEFDHSKTKYPLEGKHLAVPCETCHRRGDFKTPIAHQQCSDCHRPDPHSGQFAKRADGGACQSCHTLDAFKPAKFGLAEHQATGYPLRGKHAALQCTKCHVPAGRATLYKVKFGLCQDCHKDVHLNQFAAEPYRNRCEQCHSETSFHPSFMTLAKHQKSFALTGSHMAVACNDCHKPLANTGAAKYHFDSQNCTACHSDPHRGQFSVRMSTVGLNGKAAGCEACHSTKTWKDLPGFDHARTNFLLTGTHRVVSCEGCHRPPNMERGLTNVDFRSAPGKCEQCHLDSHGGQFAGVDGNTRCAACHNDNKWRPSLFDHEKTVFSLTGGHQNVRCGACHQTMRLVNTKTVLFYKPTPVACAACHSVSLTTNKAKPAEKINEGAREIPAN